MQKWSNYWNRTTFGKVIINIKAPYLFAGQSEHVHAACRLSLCIAHDACVQRLISDYIHQAAAAAEAAEAGDWDDFYSSDGELVVVEWRLQWRHRISVAAVWQHVASCIHGYLRHYWNGRCRWQLVCAQHLRLVHQDHWQGTQANTHTFVIKALIDNRISYICRSRYSACSMWPGGRRQGRTQRGGGSNPPPLEIHVKNFVVTKCSLNSCNAWKSL